MSENYPSTRVLGYEVYSAPLKELKISGKKNVISTLNAYSYVVARKDEEFSSALSSSELLIADGFPVVLAARVLNSEKIEKIAGEDMFHFLLRKLNSESGSCFFLGAAPPTLLNIEERMAGDYPEVSVNSFSPPYKPLFSEEESQLMCAQVNQAKPDVLFVGMTAPKQEKWVEANKHRLDAGVICSIGAVFDFYAGTVNRPSPFWIKIKLEWFIRFIKEPRRLWKRYFIYSPLFFWHLLKAKLSPKGK